MHNPDRSMLGIQGHGMLHTCGTFQSGHHGSLEHADGAHLSYLFRAAPSTKRSGRSGLASHQRPNTTRSTAPSFMASSPRGLVKPPAARNAPCVPASTHQMEIKNSRASCADAIHCTIQPTFSALTHIVLCNS